MSDYPEHDKLAAIHDSSQLMGEMLDWFSENGYVIARYATLNENSLFGKDERLIEERKSITQWLAEIFDIDLIALEKEKGAMLDAYRGENS